MSTRRSRRRRSLTATLLVSAMLTAGCSSVAAAPPPVHAMGVGSDRGDADVRFSQEMISHHRCTIRLAGLVKDRTDDPYVRDLAAALVRGESADIELMTGWLRSWKAEVPAEGDPDDHGAHDMPGMVSAAQFSSLERRSGAGFDRMWLTVLGRHLDSGVRMSQVVIALGRHRPTARMAGRLVTEQRARIKEIGAKLG
ncbi:DUF305 domain-containing protein [Streptosporangium longisporum]|uniref:DUF305 domain-containing protein n=1 Tax=Streptosporangium longisporum TaxID=46187 RepID=A0ABP6LHN5_9ACTN